MEIIKTPKYMEYYGRCYECGCEFKYDPRDIKYVHIPYIQLAETPNINFDNSTFDYSYVTCPWCGAELNTEKNIKERIRD